MRYHLEEKQLRAIQSSRRVGEWAPCLQQFSKVEIPLQTEQSRVKKKRSYLALLVTIKISHLTWYEKNPLTTFLFPWYKWSTTSTMLFSLLRTKLIVHYGRPINYKIRVDITLLIWTLIRRITIEICSVNFIANYFDFLPPIFLNQDCVVLCSEFDFWH